MAYPSVLFRRIKLAQFRCQFQSVLEAYCGSEKTASGQFGWTQGLKIFFHDLLLSARQKNASGSDNPLGVAVEEMARFEKRAQMALKGVSTLFKNSPELQTAFNQGNDVARQTVNSSGKTHPLAMPLQSSVALPNEMSTDQKEMLAYLFRASDQTAEMINRGRDKPLTHNLREIRISPDVKHWGEYWPNEEIVRLSTKLKKKPGLFAQTAGHEITGHSLLEDVYENISRGVPEGFGEFLAENNSILALRLAAQEASNNGNRHLSERFTAAADAMVKDITRPANSIPPLGVPADRRIQKALQRQIQSAGRSEHGTSLANHLGQHAFFETNPPSTVLGNQVPSGVVHSSDTWTLEGIPIASELKEAYRQYLLHLVKESRNRFSKKGDFCPQIHSPDMRQNLAFFSGRY